LVKDIIQNIPIELFTGAHPHSFTNVDGVLFYESHGKLWKSNGTEVSTVKVSDVKLSDHLTNVDGILFFTADKQDHGIELWKTDGDEASTEMVRDIRRAFDRGSIPHDLTNVNGTLFFSADDGTTGRELWKTDGTRVGTVLVKDIKSGLGVSARVTNLININGTLFFIADDGVTGAELWKSDGTEMGTILVKDIRIGVLPSYLGNLTNINGTLFFVANDGINEAELWKSDGTEAGTILLKQSELGSYQSDGITNLTNFNGTLLFYDDVWDDVNGSRKRLWKSDGVNSGATMINIENQNKIISPIPESTLTSPIETFTWSFADSSAVQQWALFVGSTLGGQEYAKYGALSTTVSGLPTDSSTIYVRLWFKTGGPWLSIDATYTAATIATPRIVSPVAGTTFSGINPLFTWDFINEDVTQWGLYAGSSVGAQDYFAKSGLGTATTNTIVTGLPMNGSLIYIRFWYKLSGVWHYSDLTYSATTIVSPIMTPVTGTTLTGESQLFTWDFNGANISQWAIYAGSSMGANDYYRKGGTDNTINSATVWGLPTDGSIIYVRFWYKLAGDWYQADVTYAAANIALPEILSPAPTSKLYKANVLFTWDYHGTNVSQWALTAGSSLGADDYYRKGGIDNTINSATVWGLPTDGSTVYVRLWYKVAGKWKHINATYTVN